MNIKFLAHNRNVCNEHLQLPELIVCKYNILLLPLKAQHKGLA